MGQLQYAVIKGKSANKVIMVGVISAAELIEQLRSQTISVNKDAQRTLANSSAEGESTVDLLENDTIEKKPRMKNITKFLDRIMNKVEKENGNNEEGFFGCLQLAIPEEFNGAEFISVGANSHEYKDQNLPNALYTLINSSRGNNLGVLKLSTNLSEKTAMFIGDGQGRAFGFYSFLRKVDKEIVELKKKIKNKNKKNQLTDEEETALVEQEQLRERINKFLSETDVAFMCYASSVNEKGQIKGLNEKAQARLFIEGNALNAQATQEDVLRYESISPIISQLQQERLNHKWMYSDYIDENKKSISKSSTKLFTLSALVQAYSISFLGESKPNDLNEETFDKVTARADFVSNFWQHISELYQPIWIPEIYPYRGYYTRSEYIQAMRGDKHRNVLFQAVFLQALGKLCYKMGQKAHWNEQSEIFQLLTHLSLSEVNYDAVEKYQENGQGKPTIDWCEMWKNSIMTSTSKGGYSFNNTKGSVDNAAQLLADLMKLHQFTESEVSQLNQSELVSSI